MNRVQEDILKVLRSRPCARRELLAEVSGARADVLKALTQLRMAGRIKRAELPPGCTPFWLLAVGREGVTADEICPGCNSAGPAPYTLVYPDPLPKPPQSPTPWKMCRDCVAGMIIRGIAVEYNSKLYASTAKEQKETVYR